MCIYFSLCWGSIVESTKNSSIWSMRLNCWCKCMCVASLLLGVRWETVFVCCIFYIVSFVLRVTTLLLQRTVYQVPFLKSRSTSTTTIHLSATWEERWLLLIGFAFLFSADIHVKLWRVICTRSSSRKILIVVCDGLQLVVFNASKGDKAIQDDQDQDKSFWVI